MIALDTNVLIRFLVEDDAEQTERATRLLSRADERGEPCFVSDVVVCETVWVLQRSYRLGKSEIVEILDRLLRARQLCFDSTDRLADALAAFAQGRGDFADYLIREQAREAGFDSVATFDGALLSEAGFQQV